MSTTLTERQARKQVEREAKLEAVQQRLTTAVEQLVTGDDWRRALEFSAKFRSRSFRNSMLIAVQHAEAYEQGRVPTPFPSYVAGYKQWLTLGRQVRKGEAGYQILSPKTARFATSTPSNPSSWRRLATNEKAQPGETQQTRMTGVRLAYVWDISSTDGDDLPTTPAPRILKGEAPEGLWDGLADLITEEGYELRLVSNATAIGGANGLTDFQTREVSVRVDMDDSAQVKSLCHELGHVLLTDPDSPDAPFHRGIAEVEAESVALMVGAAHGMDTSAYTVPYVTTWANTVPETNPVDVIQATAERVRRAALGILDRLDTRQTDTGAPPGLEPRVATAKAPQAERTVQHVKPIEAIGL